MALMIYKYESAKVFLQQHFEEKVRRNPRYSLRSYSKYLGVSAAELSQVFRGKRNLSFSSAKKVIQSMGLNSDESKHFLWGLQVDKGKSQGFEFDPIENKPKQEIPMAVFSNICEWYHFAIICLLDTKNFVWKSSYISKRLGISVSEAGLAMQDLQKVGLVSVEKDGAKAKKAVAQISSPLPSDAIRKYHQQMLMKALDSLSYTPIDKREFQSMGIALEDSDLKKVKKEIDEFTDRLISKYHKKSANHVYQIQVCTFPLTQGVEK